VKSFAQCVEYQVDRGAYLRRPVKDHSVRGSLTISFKREEGENNRGGPAFKRNHCHHQGSKSVDVLTPVKKGTIMAEVKGEVVRPLFGCGGENPSNCAQSPAYLKLVDVVLVVEVVRQPFVVEFVRHPAEHRMVPATEVAAAASEELVFFLATVVCCSWGSFLLFLDPDTPETDLLKTPMTRLLIAFSLACWSFLTAAESPKSSGDSRCLVGWLSRAEGADVEFLAPELAENFAACRNLILTSANFKLSLTSSKNLSLLINFTFIMLGREFKLRDKTIKLRTYIDYKAIHEYRNQTLD